MATVDERQNLTRQVEHFEAQRADVRLASGPTIKGQLDGFFYGDDVWQEGSPLRSDAFPGAATTIKLVGGYDALPLLDARVRAARQSAMLEAGRTNEGMRVSPQAAPESPLLKGGEELLKDLDPRNPGGFWDRLGELKTVAILGLGALVAVQLLPLFLRGK